MSCSSTIKPAKSECCEELNQNWKQQIIQNVRLNLTTKDMKDALEAESIKINDMLYEVPELQINNYLLNKKEGWLDFELTLIP